MSVSDSGDIFNSVQYDKSIPAVSSPDYYSTATTQNLAMVVPLGSQLNLLNAQNAGNPYLNMARVSNPKMPGDLMPTTYDTLGQNNQGSHFRFSSAYGYGQ
jgi:hypothetical protein